MKGGKNSSRNNLIKKVEKKKPHTDLRFSGREPETRIVRFAKKCVRLVVFLPLNASPSHLNTF